MLKEEWLAFIEDRAPRSSGYFATLLVEDENWKDPHSLFGGLPKGMALCDRIEKLTQDFKLRGGYFVPDPDLRATKNEMRNLVAQHTAMMADLGQDEGETEDAAALRAAPLHFFDSHDAFTAVMRDHKREWNEIPDLLDDVYIAMVNATDKRYRVISEAILEMTKSKEVTMWVMAEFIGLRLDMKPGYDIFLRGGVMAFPRDETVVYIW